MKLVQVDNFNRDTVSDSLIAENVPSIWALRIADLLNQKYGGEDSQFYVTVKPDDYKLYVFEP